MATNEMVDDVSDVEEIDPNKLVSKDGVLGFEKGSGFEQVTNFNVEIDGYVGDGEGNVIGYIIRVVLAVVDPLLSITRTSR
jgi:hypothetical protein